MNYHKYQLELYHGIKSRYTCPQCGKRGEFTRYIDTQTGNYLSDIVGKCNRVDHCGYHYTPKQYFKDNPEIKCNTLLQSNFTKTQYSIGVQPVTYCNTQKSVTPVTVLLQPSFIDTSIFQSSLTGYDRNIFTLFLTGLFGTETTNEVIKRYRIGTSKHWQGATIFYQIDIDQNIRAGKIMLYDQSGHRVKEPFNYVTWVHKVLKIDNYSLQQALFGEHLLKGNTLPIAIVESEKTAIISSVYLPQFLWLACGQLQGLSVDKCKVLSGRTVILFPDLKGFEKWQQKAKELQSLLPDVRFAVSDYLEKNASEADRQKGLDIADYLIKFEVKDFRHDVPAKPDHLKRMIEQGNKDAALYSSGAINQEQWFEKTDALLTAILGAGFTLNEYVKAANS